MAVDVCGAVWLNLQVFLLFWSKSKIQLCIFSEWTTVMTKLSEPAEEFTKPADMQLKMCRDLGTVSLHMTDYCLCDLQNVKLCAPIWRNFFLRNVDFRTLSTVRWIQVQLISSVFGRTWSHQIFSFFDAPICQKLLHEKKNSSVENPVCCWSCTWTGNALSAGASCLSGGCCSGKGNFPAIEGCLFLSFFVKCHIEGKKFWPFFSDILLEDKKV